MVVAFRGAESVFFFDFLAVKQENKRFFSCVPHDVKSNLRLEPSADSSMSSKSSTVSSLTSSASGVFICLLVDGAARLRPPRAVVGGFFSAFLSEVLVSETNLEKGIK